jgi:D-aminoacyl-tRNA deacylase
MIGLLQRVDHAKVVIAGVTAAEIGAGLLVLICAERGDTDRQADALLTKLLGYRVFADENGRMNRSLTEVQGALMLVPQFTLAADTRGGARPSFTPAAEPVEGRRLFEYLAARAIAAHSTTTTGVFGADMKVHLVNDGPVTFWLRVPPLAVAQSRE